MVGEIYFIGIPIIACLFILFSNKCQMFIADLLVWGLASGDEREFDGESSLNAITVIVMSIMWPWLIFCLVMTSILYLVRKSIQIRDKY